MRLLRPTAIIAAFLIITVSIPPAPLSQPAPKQSQPKQPAPPKRQAKRPQRADALASAINELLKLDPLPPPAPDDKNSDNADASSEEQRKPPADDAPIKELIDYWRRGHGANAPKPSDKVRRRLLEACEDRPELIIGLVNFLPETADTHDLLYKLLEENPLNDSDWEHSLLYWLQNNSRYFRDDLIAAARYEAVKGTSSGNNLRSLARLDWEAARPIVEALASAGNARMTTIALSLFYEHAQAAGDSGQAEHYRALLKVIVVNQQFPHEARQTALSSLAGVEWDGQADWVVSLFADPTLGGLKEVAGENEGGAKGASEKKSEKEARDGYIQKAPNILSSLLGGNPEKWLPVISNLVGHNHRIVHQSAVRCLVTYLNSLSADIRKNEIAKKLAPWLTDPDWAAANDRSGFIQSLCDVDAPELLSGLLWVLEHDEDEDNRAAVADALTQYRDQAAIPALRHALENEEDENRREQFVTALAECGGFSDDEMAAAIEAYAKSAVTKEGEQESDPDVAGDSGKPIPLKVSIGRILHKSETIRAPEGLVVRLIERAKALRKSQPAVARKILQSIEGVPLSVAEINLVERIGAGWADLDALKLALENRDSVRKSAGDELYKLIKQGGYAAGLAATILYDEREQRETLIGTEANAKLALLAGARYLRDKLPIDLAGRLLESQNRALAKAAESYLEVEDSAEARKLVLARHRGEAYIVGDGAGIDHARYGDWEEAARKEIKSRNDLEAIYALGLSGLPEFHGVFVRVRGGKAEISLYGVKGRRDFRMLTESEFEELKSFTSRQKVEDLGPEQYVCPPHQGCYKYLRLTKSGGRRIVLAALRRAPKNPTLHEELSGLFYRLTRSGEFVTRYAIEDKIPGVEVLLADKKQEATMVCGEGREIRVLIWQKGGGYMRGFDVGLPEWREFSSGAPGNATGEPSACPVLGLLQSFMNFKGNDYSDDLRPPARAGGPWVFSSSGEDAGIWKVEPGAGPVKIVSGSYAHPVATPDGKWLVAIKTTHEGGEYSRRLVRLNLQTMKEFPVNMPNGDYRPPVTYVAAHGKILLGRAGFHREAYLGETNYLLDPETGTLQQVKGEFSPLANKSPRELQPTGNPNEFWAAIHDEQKKATRFGRYDSRNFVFTPLVELPGLTLDNNNFWVDVDASKIWFTYQGHLLRLRLSK